ncbi:MAG TPA: DNA internalization-related competence protein ComEC/Rec2 [Longimicrobium sp.]|nr:DNA internalization-related competence protein ComEC/Rec2 [Longimicrobium sp.]
MHALRLPLVAALLAFLAGLLFGLRVPAATPALALAAAPILLAVVLHRPLVGTPLTPRTAEFLLLAALAFAGAGHGAAGRLDARADCRATLEDGTGLVVRGALAANFVPPRDSAARNPLLPLVVAEAATARGPVPNCDGEMRVRFPRRTAEALRAGAEVELAGEWRLLPAPVTPSAWPRSPAYRGFVAVKTVSAARPPSLARHPLLTTRGRTERQLHRLFPRHGPLADALLLGRRETLDRALADRFAKSGLVHLLAISGTHVALMGAVFVLLGRVARLSRARVAALTIALVAAYLAMIGAPPSALRSGVMLALSLLALVLQRPSSPLPIVAAAALALLAMDPMTALDIGFQLSFAGVLGLVLLRGAMWKRLPKAVRRGKLSRPVAESLVMSVAAFVVTAPVVAHHFGQVAPVSVLANLPAVPLTSLALIGIGAAAVTEPVLPALAHLFAGGAGLALDLLDRTVDLAVALPGGHAAVARPQWWLWALAALAFLAALDLAGTLRARVRWAVAAGSASAAFLVLPVVAAGDGGGLEIAFLDVGQGDAVALRTPAGRWLLVDAGPLEEGFDAGEKRVLPFLRAQGARRIEAMVLTHPHADHIGGAAAVLRALPVAAVVEPGLPYPSPVYLATLDAATDGGTAWRAARQDRSLHVDGVELSFLWPVVDVLDAPADANDISVVVQVRYGAFAALLTGDAPASVEAALVARYGERLRAHVLKAGHHGSVTSTSEGFLDAVRPALAVLSLGRRNEYGHPSPAVVDRLERRGVEVARTDEDGTVIVRVAPGGAAWRVE